MYAKIINSKVEQYPFYIQTLKHENPNTSFPNNIEMDYATLKEYNVFRVFETSQPGYDPKSQHIQETTPIFNNERWERAWKVVDLSEDEIAQIEVEHQEQVRQQRQAAYEAEADPLFFKWQRGEATQQEWLDKIAEIKERYPD